ncbi:ABC transporter permease subunit [Acuticoccus sediminis]|uniref:ABC transporter permease subunit n=1 Tax=Acuticoccus sediminis TaxID=2184697 RepID=UPI001CFD03C3|nr:ABC transporter permease subunit [Acuticoccus sediminis]
MGAYLRAFGWPLGTLFLVVTVAWIAGMIVVPQLTMLERAFVYIDNSDDLTVANTRLNRLTRDIATVALDIRVLERQRDAGGSAGAAPSPTVGVPTVGVPSVSGPSTPRPSVPSVAVPNASGPSAGPATPAVPSVTIPSAALPTPGGAPAADTGQDVEARIAALGERKAALEARLAELETERDRLAEEKAAAPHYSVRNFTTMSEVHLRIFLSTLFYATLVTVIAFVVCYPVAFAVAMSRSGGKTALLLLGLVIPYTINELLRIFAWVMILEREGVLNSLLTALGVFPDGGGPRWVASNWAVFTVMIYAYVLFMVFPLYNTLDTLDRNQIDAARDLGASTFKLHTRIVIPHAKPGIAVGAIMVFMLSAGTIAAPEIVGRGLHPDWFSQVIYRRFFESANWNQGSAYSLMLLLACVIFVMLVMRLFRVSIRDIAK